MAKANTKNKSKPTKKTAHKTFHKHIAEEPVTLAQESDSQITSQSDEKVIQPEVQPEEEITPTNPQPAHPEENIAPTSAITPSTVDITPNAVNDAPTTGDNNIATAVENEPTPIPLPEEQKIPEPQSTLPIGNQEEGKSKKPIIIIAVIIILIALASGYFLYSKKIKSASQKTQSVDTQTQSSPEPSPQSLNKAQWTLEILNGSAKKGAAAALAEKLTAKGYQVIKTGNAEKDIATSEVLFADSKTDQADLFLEDIKEDLPNPTNAGGLADSTASARIIIGAE